MTETKIYAEYCRELQKEAASEILHQGEDLVMLKEYINRLEAERDYYRESSSFDGVPDTPKPQRSTTVCRDT